MTRAILMVLCALGAAAVTAAPARTSGDGAAAMGEPAVCLLKEVEPTRPSWSPDGESVVVEQFALGLAIASLADQRVRPLTPEAHDNSPEWSPNSNRIVYTRSATETGNAPDDATVFVLTVGSEERPQALASGIKSSAAAHWSEDGRAIAVVGNRGVVVVDDSGEKSILPRPRDGTALASEARWLGPDRLLVELRDAEGPMALAVPVAGGAPTVVTRLGHAVRAGVDGSLWIIGDALARADLLAVDGEDAHVVVRGPVRSYDVDRTRRRVVAAVEGRGLVLYDTISSEQAALTDDASDGSPAWSPDGRRVAFIRRDERDGYRLCWVTVGDEQESRFATRERWAEIIREADQRLSAGDLKGALDAFERADEATLFEVPNYQALIKVAEVRCLAGDRAGGLTILRDFRCMLAVEGGRLACYVEPEERSLGRPNPELPRECFERMCSELYLPYYEDSSADLLRRLDDLSKEADRVEALCGAKSLVDSEG